MPSESKSQQRAFQAAKHGADFPLARKLRASMSAEQLDDFATGSMVGKPEHVKKKAAPSIRNLKARLHSRK